MEIKINKLSYEIDSNLNVTIYAEIDNLQNLKVGDSVEFEYNHTWCSGTITDFGYRVEIKVKELKNE